MLKALVPIVLLGLFLIVVPSASANIFVEAINKALFGVFNLVSLFISLGAIVLGAAVDANMVRELFNLGAIYALWQMVRDFFNLFFILVLLFVAFATIFQIQAYSYRKWLLNIVLMALLVNFSFPVTRFIIDATNVPMYFFLENTFSGKTEDGKVGQETVEKSLNVSGIKNVLLTGKEDEELKKIKGDAAMTQQLIGAIIFVFILGIILLLLALQFLIRLIVLVILIIFSPVGFAGLAIPGFGGFAKKWWNYLIQYAIFGPAAALMLLVAIKVMGAFNTTMSGYVEGQGESSGAGSMVISFSRILVPVILLWTAMSVGKMVGIAGGAGAAAWGQKMAKGGLKRMSGANYAQKQAKAFAGEFQKQRAAAKAPSLGTRLGGAAGATAVAAQTKAGTKASRNAARDSYQKHQQELVEDATKRNRVNAQMNESDLRALHEKARGKNDKALLAATTKEMAGRKDMAEEVTESDVAAVKGFFKDIGGSKNAVAGDVTNSVAKHNAAAAYAGDADAMRQAFEDGKIKIEEQSASGLTKDVLAAANTAGRLDEKQLAEMNKDSAKAAQLKTVMPEATKAVADAYEAKVKNGTNGVDDDKAMERMQRMHLAQTGEWHEASKKDAGLQLKVLKKSTEETLKELGKKNDGKDLATIMPKMLAAAGPNRTVNILSKLADEGIQVKPSTGTVMATAASSGAGMPAGTRDAAQSAQKIMEKDHRFGWVRSEGSSKSA